MEKDEKIINGNKNTSSETLDSHLTVNKVGETSNNLNELSDSNESDEIHKKEKLVNEEIQKINQRNLKRYVNLKENKLEFNIDKQRIIPVVPEKRKLAKFKGRSLFLFLDKFGNPLLIIGPHWGMYVCFCGIISLLMILIYIYLWKNLGPIMKILGKIIFWTYFLSYSYTSLINPGYPKNTEERKNGLPRKNYYYCERCKFYIKKNTSTTHCYECDICIEKQDHHCPWTGHCIGKNNLWSFYIFIGASFLVIIYLACAFCAGMANK